MNNDIPQVLIALNDIMNKKNNIGGLIQLLGGELDLHAENARVLQIVLPKEVLQPFHSPFGSTQEEFEQFRSDYISKKADYDANPDEYVKQHPHENIQFLLFLPTPEQLQKDFDTFVLDYNIHKKEIENQIDKYELLYIIDVYDENTKIAEVHINENDALKYPKKGNVHFETGQSSEYGKSNDTIHKLAIKYFNDNPIFYGKNKISSEWDETIEIYDKHTKIANANGVGGVFHIAFIPHWENEYKKYEDDIIKIAKAPDNTIFKSED